MIGCLANLIIFVFNLSIGGKEDDQFSRLNRLRPLAYPHTDFLLMLFCVESNETLQNCVQLWGPEVSHHCVSVPIILVAVSHCYRPHLFDGQATSNGCVTEKEGNKAAKKIGMFIKL